MSEVDAKALAAEIAGEWFDDTSIDPKPTEGTPVPNPNTTPVPNEGEVLDGSTEGTKENEGEQEDADPLGKMTLKQLLATGKPVDELLKLPQFAPALNSYADRVANSRLESERGSIRAQTQAQIEDEVVDQYFSNLERDPAKLAEELAKDQSLPVQYAQYKQRQSEANQPDHTAAILTEAYMLQVRAVSQKMAAANFPPEVLETLHPDKFRHLGAEGITAWSNAVDDAIITKRVSEGITKELGTKWESFREEQLAKESETIPGATVSRGSRNAPLPDLEKTNSQFLLEDAFSKVK